MFNVSNNQIVSIPSNALKDLANLKHLDVANNKLNRLLDNQFVYLTSIESINMSNNQINSIQPFTLIDLLTLHELDLSKNQLQTDDFLEQSAPVNSINLSNNRYQQINLLALKNVGTIHLNGNRWNCSWLLHALKSNEYRMANIQFGFEFDDVEHDSLIKPMAEEVECFDYRQSIDHPTIKRIIILHSDNCATGKSSENEPKVKQFHVLGKHS